jgi:hypothetical protein
MARRNLALILPILIACTPLLAQYDEGDFMISFGGSWKSEEYRVKETIDQELDLMVGYHPLKRMGVGLVGNWGLTEFSYAEEDPGTGITYTNYKKGNWGGIGPYIRGHLGPPEFSAFAQLSAVFGKLEQDSENNLTDGNYLYYRQEGNFQQYSFGAGVWWYFTRRIGVEVLGLADWTVANVRSGNVGSDGEVDNYNSERYEASGGGWSLKLLYWFRLDGGARKPGDPGS